MLKDKLTIGSLFSGVGGFELGFEQTGHYETKWQCENASYQRKVLHKHWPTVPCYEDITELCIKNNPEPVDVIVGGFPCPAFSRAGKEGGFEQDPLFYEMLRVCKTLNPRYIVFENVKGFTKWSGTLHKEINSMGYEWIDGILDARDFGIPQARERYFAICVQRGIMPGPQHIRGFQRNGSESVFRIQPNNQNSEGRWASTVSSKEEWRAIFANSRRMRDSTRIPARMDRLKCCGNAFPPPMSKFLGWAVYEFEKHLEG